VSEFADNLYNKVDFFYENQLNKCLPWVSHQILNLKSVKLVLI
jgi:hypothetical protein